MSKVIEFINQRIKLTVFIVLALAVPAFVLTLFRSSAESDFNPSGGVFAVDVELDAAFVPSTPVEDERFMVESQGDNVLSPAALREFSANSAALRRDVELQGRLRTTTLPALGVEVEGVWSFVDAVDQAVGGVDGASDDELTSAVNALLDERPGLAGTLATSTTRAADDWSSPALLAFVAFDASGMEDPDNATGDPDKEEYLRDVQDVLRGDEANIAVLGLAIDPALTQFDGAALAIPFLLLAVVAIVFVVGILLRSYWSAAIVGAGLGLVMVFMAAVLTLTFRGTSLLVALVVPISVISFGVDFFIHAMGRIREEQHGKSESESYRIGIGAVVGALMLAMGSSAVAFLSNTVSGIEAVIDFGIAAASALVFAFVLLGLVAPRLVVMIESSLGGAPAGGVWGRRIGFFFMSLFAGMAVALMATAPEPALRVAALAVWLVFVGVFIVGAYRLALRRSTGDVGAAAPAGEGRVEWVGSMVHFLVKWRWATLSVAAVVGALSVVSALNVESGTEFRDFFSTETDFVRSLDVAEEHFSAASTNEVLLFVEGDLTDPSVLRGIDAAVASVDAALPGAGLPRRADGSFDRQLDAAVIAAAAVTDSTFADAVASETGISISDDDGDGFPDTAAQIDAALSVAVSDGVGSTSPASVQTVLQAFDSGRGTIVDLSVPTQQGLDGVDLAIEAAAAAGAQLEATSGGSLSRVIVAGDATIQQEQLDEFTRAMLIALPIAVLLCISLAAVVMRSVKFALVAVLPILLVVVMLYGFMTVAGFKVNPVSSTLAAIAVGIGIDFATHFTMRYREELARFEPLEAMREAGAGTGGALLLSAVSSIIGFVIMGFAPMPAFAWFGQLTAVMIVLSVGVALLVLPSLLMVVTPRPRQEPAVDGASLANA